MSLSYVYLYIVNLRHSSPLMLCRSGNIVYYKLHYLVASRILPINSAVLYVCRICKFCMWLFGNSVFLQFAIQE